MLRPKFCCIPGQNAESKYEPDRNRQSGIPDVPGAGQIKAVDEGFGTDTAPDRTIIAGLEPKSGLVLAGRLALGRIIGTEAIHDCFEGDLDLWTAEMKF